MRAFVLSDFESPPTLAEIPMPEPGPGEVLVRVQASSLNGFDLAVAAGMLKGMMEYRFPVVLGGITPGPLPPSDLMPPDLPWETRSSGW